jgi:cysteine desulfuration protein SufE
MSGLGEPAAVCHPRGVGADLDRIVQSMEGCRSWEERCRFLIGLGRTLRPLPPEEQTEENRVQGCLSKVWVKAQRAPESPVLLRLEADSDAAIVKGLVALLIAAYSGRTAAEILAFDVRELLTRLDLQNQLSPSRSNGLFSMVERIRALARDMG